MEIVCIFTIEAAEILRSTVRQAQRKFREIRRELNKKKGQPITIKDFADYTGIPEATIYELLTKQKK
jgi:predicted transcriptional regulator